MQKIHIALLLLLAASVSCERMRMLWKDGQSTHLDLNCKNWDKEAGTCIQCYQGCTKWENICVRIVKYCAQWDDQGNCTKCQPGYGDSQGKSVNGSCPKQQTQTQNTQTSSNESPPPKKNESLQSQQPQVQIPLVDIHCQCHTQDRQCIDCFNGYFLDFNATCQQIPKNCTAANELGECTACVNGFVVESGSCVQRECDLALCTVFNQDQTQCTACSFRSYLENGCCTQVNGFCSAWVELTGECTACYQGYEIDPNNNKQCIPTSQ